MHPHLDLLDELVRIVGVPALFGAIVWAVKKVVSVNKDFQHVALNAAASAAGVQEVKAQVTVLQTNHMAHLQTDMTRVAVASEEQLKVLNDIKTNMAVVLDRIPR